MWKRNQLQKSVASIGAMPRLFLYVVCHTMTNPQNQLYFSSTSGNMFPPFINRQNVLLMGVPVVNEHAVLSFQPPFILKHLSVKKMLKADLKTAWEV